jgi:acetyl-CoA synthetase
MQPKPNDIYWCTADPAWITGSSYGIIAPFAAGLTQVQFGGNFDPELWFGILEQHDVNILYTAPTVLRMMMQYDDDIFKRFELSKLRQIFSVGEPLNPNIYEWALRILGKEVFDTWFQTETGSILIANRPGLQIKPGSMGKPLSYIEPGIFDENMCEKSENEIGRLCLKSDWKSMFVSYINQEDAYSSKFKKGFYISGDLARKDEDGYYWFIGRDDDVINTAGHLVSPFEVESSIIELPEIADVGVIAAPDDLLWEKVVAFIKLKPGIKWDEKSELKLRVHVSNKVSPIAAPMEVRIVSTIPKNRSGKIMRRILKAIYTGKELGDISTMEEF